MVGNVVVSEQAALIGKMLDSCHDRFGYRSAVLECRISRGKRALGFGKTWQELAFG